MIEFTVYEGEEFSRVLARRESSPTGYMSMTGAFPTPKEAIAANEEDGAFDNNPRRYVNLDTGETLAEYGPAKEEDDG